MRFVPARARKRICAHGLPGSASKGLASRASPEGPAESDSDDAKPLLLSPAGRDPKIRDRLWYIELTRMITENGMFLLFIASMLHRIPRRK